MSELKVNVGKYVEQADAGDIYITRNGKQVAKIVYHKHDREKEMRALFGIAKLPPAYEYPMYDPNYDALRDGKLAE